MVAQIDRSPYSVGATLGNSVSGPAVAAVSFSAGGVSLSIGDRYTPYYTIEQVKRFPIGTPLSEVEAACNEVQGIYCPESTYWDADAADQERIGAELRSAVQTWTNANLVRVHLVDGDELGQEQRLRKRGDDTHWPDVRNDVNVGRGWFRARIRDLVQVDRSGRCRLYQGCEDFDALRKRLVAKDAPKVKGDQLGFGEADSLLIAVGLATLGLPQDYATV